MLRKRIHISWHIAWTAGGVVSGVALALLFPAGLFGSVVWLVVACVFCGVVVVGRIGALCILALAAGLLLGLWRGSAELAHLQGYNAYYGQMVTVRGKVTEDTTFDTKGSQRLRIGAVYINGQSLHGHIWSSTPSSAAIKRGDIVTLRGSLSEGFGNLPATMHRAELVRIERPHPGDVARRVRDWFAEGVRQAIPEPEASLGIGFLTGQRSTLPEELDNQLRLLGLTHIVVASGYNLTILVRLARRMAAGVSKYLSTLSASVMIVGFMLVTGLGPSMSRAGLVAGLSLAAWYYGRTIHPLVLLPFAAAVTVLINPTYVWGDLGWYLSFASFVGVIVLAPLIQQYFWGDTKPGVFRQILIDTTAAQLVTLPIIAFAFGEYSPLALVANLLILPLVPLAMLLTFIGGIAGIAIPQAAPWIGGPASGVLQYMTAVVERLAALPWAHGELAVGIPMLVVSYLVLLLGIVFLRRKTAYDFRRHTLVE
jgi:competence protein ComEC